MKELTWKAYREIRKQWFGENRTDSKKNYRKYCEKNSMMFIDLGSTTTPSSTTPAVADQISDIRSAWTSAAKYSKEKEGNNPMCYKCPPAIKSYSDASNVSLSVNASEQPSQESKAQSYLLDRLQGMIYSKRRDLENQFNLYGRAGPKTLTELLELLKGGKFEVSKYGKKLLNLEKNAAEDEDDDDDFFSENPSFYIGSFLDYVDFIGLKDQPDRDGYLKASDTLDKLYQSTRDQIMVFSAAEGLKALNEFEAWTFQATKN